MGRGMDATSLPVLQDSPWRPPAAFAAPARKRLQPQISTLLCRCGDGNHERRPRPPAAADAGSRPRTRARAPRPKCDGAGAFAPLLPGLGSGDTGLGARGFFGPAPQAGSNQSEGEREQLLTKEMSHLFSSVIGACSRQGADTEVILVLGCTILRWQSLSVEAGREKRVSNTMPKQKVGETVCLPFLLTTLLSYYQYSQGRLLRFLLFKQIFLLSSFPLRSPPSRPRACSFVHEVAIRTFFAPWLPPKTCSKTTRYF